MQDKDALVKKRMKKRTAAAGAGIVGLALLLSWLLNLFNFGGGDGGDGDKDADSGTAAVSMVAPDADVIPVTQSQMGNFKVLEILIDDRSYYVRAADSDDEYLAKPLDEVIRLTKTAEGNADGIRVRISRRKDARISAQQDLQRALQDAGLSEDDWLLLKEYVE